MKSHARLHVPALQRSPPSSADVYLFTSRTASLLGNFPEFLTGTRACVPLRQRVWVCVHPCRVSAGRGWVHSRTRP